MHIRDYLRVFKQYWFVIVAVAVAVFGITAFVTYSATPLYRSTAAIYVSPSGTTPNELSQGTTFLQGQMESYAELVETSTVLEPVIAELGLLETPKALSKSIAAKASGTSVILKVSATWDSAETAAQLANAAAASLSNRITELAPARPDGSASVEVEVVQSASVPEKPFSPQVGRNLMAGLVAGLLLGYLAALLVAVLDTRLRTPEQIREVAKSPVIAQLPTTGDTALAPGSRGAYAEAFRRLRANLDFIDAGDRPLQLVVTSSVVGEGKSTVAVNIARACAETGQRVLLIDADLRRPTVHTQLGLDSSIGLSTVLAGKAQLDDAVLPIGRGGNFHVLPSGILPPNPTELIESTAMEHLLAETKHSYDIVIIDSPPVLAVVDAVVLARKASGAVLVGRLGKLRRDELKRALENFEHFGSPLLGIVFNGLPKADKSPYHQALKETREGKAAKRGQRKASASSTDSQPVSGGAMIGSAVRGSH